MILPSKYTRETHALVGVGAILIDEVRRPCTVSALWERVHDSPSVATFERFVLGLELLYLLGLVSLADGIVERTES